MWLKWQLLNNATEHTLQLLAINAKKSINISSKMQRLEKKI
jgi:hypothetical protein